MSGECHHQIQQAVYVYYELGVVGAFQTATDSLPVLDRLSSQAVLMEPYYCCYKGGLAAMICLVRTRLASCCLLLFFLLLLCLFLPCTRASANANFSTPVDN